MIMHKKEIGTGDTINPPGDSTVKKHLKEKNVMGDDGFMIIKKK